MTSGRKQQQRGQSHPYLSGNFAPVHKTFALTACDFSGEIPKDLTGGQYVRNGGNPISNDQLSRDAHWFDGDGMLAGILFERNSRDGSIRPRFVNRPVLTDVYLFARPNPNLATPVLPSISTLIDPRSSLLLIMSRILRTILLTVLSLLPGSPVIIKRISVANTGITYHDGRALATCESGPPMRVQLPELETVGWFDGNIAEGEHKAHDYNHDTIGGPGLLGFFREWTTGHPKIDPVTGEMLLYHCSFLHPYIHYSVIPPRQNLSPNKTNPMGLTNVPIPRVSGPKLMHDFGVSRNHTVIMDLPLSLDPLNLLKGRPVVSYDPSKPSRFGVFPRRDPSQITWFESSACCIFHTANTWDVEDKTGKIIAVNMLACRLTSAAMIFNAGNIMPPASKDLPVHGEQKGRRYSTSVHGDPESWQETDVTNESTPLRYSGDVEAGQDTAQEEQCRLYLYSFSMLDTRPTIRRYFALSSLPF